MNGKLYFAAENGSDGPQLWTSDGTSTGTHMVSPIGGRTQGSASTGFTAVGSMIYFSAYDGPEHGSELWKTDGSSAGTMLVKDIAPGFEDGVHLGDTQGVGFKNKFFFVGNDLKVGAQLQPFQGRKSRSGRELA
jgi:ELWxxDGT repeat protein